MPGIQLSQNLTMRTCTRSSWRPPSLSILSGGGPLSTCALCLPQLQEHWHWLFPPVCICHYNLKMRLCCVGGESEQESEETMQELLLY